MKRLSTALLAAMALTGAAALANAQELMGDRAWDFSNQTSRASVASLMLQQEQSQNGAATGYYGAGQACGGGGESTSMANYTCIIINDSTAAIDALQDNQGNQNSNADSDVTVNGESMGDVLESLTN